MGERERENIEWIVTCEERHHSLPMEGGVEIHGVVVFV